MLSPQARQKIAIMLNEKKKQGLIPPTPIKPFNNMSTPPTMTALPATSMPNPMTPATTIPKIGRFSGIKNKLRGF